MGFFVYILLCSDNTFYIGKTVNVAKRLRAHNGEIKGGARYTSGRRPVGLVYSEKFETVTKALKREYELKQLTREEKEKLIKKIGNNVLIRSTLV